jgi:hypothetical protein
MPSEVRQYLDTALSFIEQERIDRRAAPRVRLSSDTHEDRIGTVNGALEISIRTAGGDEPVILREVFTNLRSKEDVDDMLARALSVLLMNHADWLR